MARLNNKRSGATTRRGSRPEGCASSATNGNQQPDAVLDAVGRPRELAMAEAGVGRLEGAVLLCAVAVVVVAVHAANTSPEWLPVESLAVVVVSAFLAAFFIPFLYHRRPSTGFIQGNESMNLVTTHENKPTIHGFTLVQGRLTREEVVEEMKRAGVPDRRFKRFSYCVTKDYRTREPFDPETDWPAYFYPDPDFDLSRHVRYVENKNGGPMSREDMLAFLSTVINTPPPLDRPPWEILIAQDFDGGDVSAVVLRVHHVLADGLALVTFMDAITKPAPGCDEAGSSLAAAARVGMRLMAEAGWLVQVVMWMRLMVEFPLIMMKDYVLPRADRNVFKRPLTGRKKLGWSMNRLDMGRVKAVRRAHQAKINDLFLSCATGTLRNLCLASHSRAGGTNDNNKGGSGEGAGVGGGGVPYEMKMYTPISVRESLEQCHDLSNMLSVLLVPLPTRIEDPVTRLRHIESVMNRKKRSIVPWGLARIMGAMGTMPRALLSRQMAYLYNKVTAVLTNVPGPAHKRTIAGRSIEEMMFWVPGLGSIGVVLSLFSYGNKVSMGVVVDEGLPFSPEQFVEGFFQEFNRMEELAMAGAEGGK